MAKMPVSVAKNAQTPIGTVLMKRDPTDSDQSKTEIIIANPKGPSDEEVPTKFVPLGAIITDGDEINFHNPFPKKNMKRHQKPESLGKMVKDEPEPNEDSKESSMKEARLKELRLLSMGKKLLDSCKSGNPKEVKRYMLDGAPFIADWVGTSPLHYSVMNKHVEVTELLLKAGICKDARNKVDRTPLHVAANKGLAYMVKLLLSYGADVNCRDMLNMTPLHWAAESGDLLSAKILLDYGADTKVVNKFGHTAISLATRNNFPAIIKEIMETDKIHPSARMETVFTLNQKVLGPNKGINPVAEILEPNPSEVQKLSATAKAKKVVLVAKENPEGGAYRGTLQISSDVESDNDSDPSTNADGMSADSALRLLKSHGVKMVEPDKDTVVSSAVLNGHTIRLTDAGKLAFKSLEKNLETDKLTNLEQAHSPKSDSPKDDRMSPSPEEPPAKKARLPNGQVMHKVSAEQLIGMKNEKKFVIKGAQATPLPECTINLPAQNENETDDPSLLGLNATELVNARNAVYLQRMENKANLCLKQITTLKKQLKIKEEEYNTIKKQIEMFKTCSNLP